MSSNGTCWWKREETAVVIRSIAVAAMCLLNACIICGNGILITAIMSSKYLRRPTYYFIASLTVSDLAVGIFVLPFFVDLLNQNAWVYGQFLCKIWAGAHVFLCSASVYNLIAIAADRMLAVTWPLTYKAIMTPLKVKSVIALVWLSALGMTLMSLVPTWSVDTPRGNGTRMMTTCSMKSYRSDYAISSMFLSFYIPASVLVCAYICIYRTTRRVRLSQKLGQLDVASVGSGGSLPSSAGSFGGFPIGRGSRSGSIIGSTNGSGSGTGSGSGVGSGTGTITTTALDDLSLVMRPRVKSPVLLRIHKGRYHKSSVCSADQQKSLLQSKDSQPLSRLTKRLQTVPSVGLAVFLASPRRSISECMLPEDSVTLWKQRSQDDSNDGSIQSAPISPAVEGSKSWNRLEHDFWLRMAIQRKRISARLRNYAWAPRKSAIHRYQQKLSFELRALKTFAIVTVCFLMCWVGFCIVNTYDLLSPSCGWSTSKAGGLENGCAPEWALKIVTGLGYVNSALNPFIYGISNRNFRAAFKRILKLHFWK